MTLGAPLSDLSQQVPDGLARAAPRIVVEALGKRFVTQDQEASVNAVDGVSFSIAAEEFVSLLGPSGCGKSTVLNIIANLLAATSGSVSIDGTPLQPETFSSAVGYVFQKDTLFPWRNVAENVGYGLEIAGLPVAERRDRVRDALERVGLDEFANHYPAALSGGMRQRVSLMRTLITRPGILLMDEPFAALDTHTKLDMHQVLLELWEQEKQSVLFVTHDLAEALTLSDRIILMAARPGRVKSCYEVPFARPRDAVALRSTAEYADLFARIWNDLGEEFIKARRR